MLGASLAYVTLIVTDVDAAATVFARDFGLPRSSHTLGRSGTQAPVLSMGTSALVLVAPGDPFVDGAVRPGVHHIALGVADIRDAVGTAQTDGVRIAAFSDDEGLDGRPRVLLAPEATAGVLTYLTEPLAPVPAETGGMVERLDHIGVASLDNTLAVEAFVQRLGFALESQQTDTEVQIAIESFTSDTYGVVYHTRPPQPVGGLRVAFVTIGECELEFLQDFDPNGEAYVVHGQEGTTRQDRGAIARFVATRGPGLHHLALKVHDIAACLDRLRTAGHTVIDTVGRPGSRRALIGFVHPKSLYGVLVHLVQRQPV
jgi:methylmalonyl-CoA/ethylmalonyl-CoA epimerase